MYMPNYGALGYSFPELDEAVEKLRRLERERRGVGAEIAVLENEKRGLEEEFRRVVVSAYESSDGDPDTAKAFAKPLKRMQDRSRKIDVELEQLRLQHEAMRELVSKAEANVNNILNIERQNIASDLARDMPLVAEAAQEKLHAAAEVLDRIAALYNAILFFGEQPTELPILAHEELSRAAGVVGSVGSRAAEISAIARAWAEGEEILIPAVGERHAVKPYEIPVGAAAFVED